jgi:hypothetical protein
MYPFVIIRSRTSLNDRNHASLSFLNSAAISRAPSTCGQTRRLEVAVLSSKVQVARPTDGSKLDASKFRTNEISEFNYEWNEI